MFNTRFMDQVNQQMNEILSNSPLVDMEKNIKSIVTAIFSKLDLVTREEFDIQQKVLAATREKLEALERQIQDLSNK